MQNNKLVAESIKYYSERDERAFFTWLRSIGCVESAVGVGSALTISLSRTPTDGDLRELIALFWRYDVDMRQLGPFLSDKNRHWFHDMQAYWFKSVFG